MPDRPIWPLLSAVTLSALAISYIRRTGAPLWPTEAVLFMVRWLFIAAFAMFARAIRRSWSQ